MQGDIEIRMSHVEWEIASLKDGHRSQDERMTELAGRMEEHHKEIMHAITSLRDERAKREGAMEARMFDARRAAQRLKWMSFALAVIGTLAALGYAGKGQAALLPCVVDTSPPIPVQHHARELP